MLRALPLVIGLTLSPGLASASLNIVFDYRYDTSSFFGQTQRNIMEAAAFSFESRITDSLGAITSGGGNRFDAMFFHPSLDNQIVTLNSQSFALNELRIYVGALDMGGGNLLGHGGPGGFNAFGSPAFLDSLKRGQSGAPDHDFGPWGGSLSFNSAYSNWYFDPDVNTLEPFSGIDFYSVAIHEIAHVLGFGTSAAWDFHVIASTSTFSGPFSGTRLLAGNDRAHWHESLTSTIDGMGSFETAMDPTIAPGMRKVFTDLDWNGLRDVGWQVAAAPIPEPETWAMLLAGLGLVGFAVARRRL